MPYTLFVATVYTVTIYNNAKWTVYLSNFSARSSKCGVFVALHCTGGGGGGGAVVYLTMDGRFLLQPLETVAGPILVATD
jgi:hypothetical protein